MKSHIFLFLLSFMLLFSSTPISAIAAPDWPSDTGIMAESGIVIDADSGAVLFGQNIHQPYPPASITKLVTALIAVENGNLTDTVTFSDDAVNNVEQGSGNKLSIAPGDQLSMEDCLYLLLLQSSNQAGNAIAEHIAGSRDGFVKMMNDRIAELGCKESNFANPSGLNDENQYVTAYDMALISKEAFSNDQLLKIDSATKHKIPATANNPDGATFSAEHRLVITTDTASPYYFPEAVAGKTGYTSIAGNTLVTYAEKDDRHLISVILKGQPKQYFVDGKTLLEFGFSNFKNIRIAEQETSYTTGDQPVTIGDTQYAPEDLELDASAVITVPKTAGFTDAVKEFTTELPSGSPERALALLRYTYNDRQIGTASLSMKESAIPEEISPSESESDVPVTAQPDNTKSADTSRGSLVFPIVLGVLAIVAIVFTVFIVYSRKKEAEERAKRQARRRQRLKEENISEEDFEQMLQQKKSKHRNRQ